jgi:hypothetical protein
MMIVERPAVDSAGLEHNYEESPLCCCFSYLNISVGLSICVVYFACLRFGLACRPSHSILVDN